jgi:hypothetical protein
LRTFGITLFGIALAVVLYLFLCLLLLVCKLPAIGPVLYAVLLPVLVVSTGLLYFGLIAGLLAVYPAIWSGATIHEALGILWRIVTHRAVELLVNFLLLTALIALAQLILFSILLVGGLIVLGTSTFILGIENIFSFALVQADLSTAQPGYTLAISFGFAIGQVLLLTALMAIALMGLNLIYLQITKNLPLPKTREYARNPLSQDGNKTAPQATATATGSMSRNPGSGTLTETNPALPATENAKMPQICSRCRISAPPGDRFCGECGGDLKG